MKQKQLLTKLSDLGFHFSETQNHLDWLKLKKKMITRALDLMSV